jgi:hypothetical protein
MLNKFPSAQARGFVRCLIEWNDVLGVAYEARN